MKTLATGGAASIGSDCENLPNAARDGRPLL